MQDDVLIRADRVSKKFCRSLRRSLWYGLGDITHDLLGQNGRPRELRQDEFWAVDDLSFELRRGECLGLIGRNGAGKTTVLKMLSGLVRPDDGRITIKGRVGGLIALGAGFSPILTGRENIYVNGSILGMTKKEIDSKFDEIVEYAEIGDFIDAPVRSFSSGMQVRLGFAVAVVLMKPDVLLLDEVLAVGDIGFTIKCLNTVQKLVERCGVVFVSHRMQHVSRFCTRVIAMERGTALCDTDSVPAALETYFRSIATIASTVGNREAQVTNAAILVNDQSVDGQEYATVSADDRVSLTFDLSVNAGTPPVHLKIAVEDQSLTPVIAYPCRMVDGASAEFGEGSHKVQLDLGSLPLTTGRYSFSMSVLTRSLDRLARLSGVVPFQVVSGEVEWAPVVRTATATIRRSD